MIGKTISHYRIIENGGYMQTLSRQSRLRFIWLVVGFVVVAAPACAAVQPPPPPTQVAVTGPVGALVVTPEVSPDGQTVAFPAWVGRQGQV